MDSPRLILVTHKKPDFDALVSLYLWLEVHDIPWDTYDDRYQMLFVNPGKRLKTNPDDKDNLTVIHFDTGGRHDDHNFDHHQLGNRNISATGLVWQKFFTSGENPAIDELVRVVNHTDNGIKYSTEDLVARNLFSMGFYLSGANKVDPRGPDFTHTMIQGFAMLDAYRANHIEVQAFEEITQDMEIFETPLGRTVVLCDVPGDSSAIRSYLKKNYNGDRGPLVNTCIAEFSRGSIGVVVCIDPGQEQAFEYLDESDNYPDTISLSSEMEQLHDRLLSLDNDPARNIYLHQSRFALYVNRSYIITLQHVLDQIVLTPINSEAS